MCRILVIGKLFQCHPRYSSAACQLSVMTVDWMATASWQGTVPYGGAWRHVSPQQNAPGALWKNIYLSKSKHVLHLTGLCNYAFYKLFTYSIHNMESYLQNIRLGNTCSSCACCRFIIFTLVGVLILGKIIINSGLANLLTFSDNDCKLIFKTYLSISKLYKSKMVVMTGTLLTWHIHITEDHDMVDILLFPVECQHGLTLNMLWPSCCPVCTVMF